jgi:hypothetical protein
MCLFAHETAGAACTRSSLRPLFFEGERYANLGQMMSRERGSVSHRHARAGGHPVFRGVSDGTENSRCTGYPAFAGYDGGGWSVAIHVIARSACDDLSAVAVWRRRKQSRHPLLQDGLLRFARNDGRRLRSSYRDKFCSRKFNAVLANTCMLSNRSLLPVSSVIADASAPAMPMQPWPAASP